MAAADGFATYGSVGKEIAYDRTTLASGSFEDHIQHDIRLARAEGTEQVAEHIGSIFRFGRKTYSRSDLMNDNDADVATIAARMRDDLARISRRVDGLAMTATGEPIAYEIAMSADHGDLVLFTPPDPEPGVFAVGRIRSMQHDITIAQGRLAWTVTYSLDLHYFAGITGAALP